MKLDSNLSMLVEVDGSTAAVALLAGILLQVRRGSESSPFPFH